jgi:hypothetical protein
LEKLEIFYNHPNLYDYFFSDQDELYKLYDNLRQKYFDSIMKNLILDFCILNLNYKKFNDDKLSNKELLKITKKKLIKIYINQQEFRDNIKVYINQQNLRFNKKIVLMDIYLNFLFKNLNFHSKLNNKYLKKKRKYFFKFKKFKKYLKNLKKKIIYYNILKFLRINKLKYINNYLIF